MMIKIECILIDLNEIFAPLLGKYNPHSSRSIPTEKNNDLTEVLCFLYAAFPINIANRHTRIKHIRCQPTHPNIIDQCV